MFDSIFGPLMEGGEYYLIGDITRVPSPMIIARIGLVSEVVARRSELKSVLGEFKDLMRAIETQGWDFSKELPQTQRIAQFIPLQKLTEHEIGEAFTATFLSLSRLWHTC